MFHINKVAGKVWGCGERQILALHNVFPFIHSIHSFTQWSSHSRNAHSAFKHKSAVNETGRASANRGLAFQGKESCEADNHLIIYSFIRGDLHIWFLHGKKWRTQRIICWRTYHIMGGSCIVGRVILWVEFEKTFSCFMGRKVSELNCVWVWRRDVNAARTCTFLWRVK